MLILLVDGSTFGIFVILRRKDNSPFSRLDVLGDRTTMQVQAPRRIAIIQAKFLYQRIAVMLPRR